MSNCGYFLVHRKLKDDWKWQPPYRGAWSWIMAEAEWAESVGLARGQVRFSVTWARKEWGMSETGARNFLKRCEEEKDALGNPDPCILWERGRGGKKVCGQKCDQSCGQRCGQLGIITVLNYDKYQPNGESVCGQRCGESGGERCGPSLYINKEEKELLPPEEESGGRWGTKAEQLKKIRAHFPELRKKFPYLDIDHEFEAWHDWLLANGKRPKNYLAAFRNWCRMPFKKPKTEELTPHNPDWDWK